MNISFLSHEMYVMHLCRQIGLFDWIEYYLCLIILHHLGSRGFNCCFDKDEKRLHL